MFVDIAIYDLSIRFMGRIWLHLVEIGQTGLQADKSVKKLFKRAVAHSAAISGEYGGNLAYTFSTVWAFFQTCLEEVITCMEVSDPIRSFSFDTV